jgi:hypothetical protein
MLFNNVYSTDFAQWIDGTWSSRVRLWVPDQEQPTDQTLIGTSWEARDACLAAVSDAPPGKLPPTAAGLSSGAVTVRDIDKDEAVTVNAVQMVGDRVLCRRGNTWYSHDVAQATAQPGAKV